MKTILKTALVALSLAATATGAIASQGDQITAMGYGKTMQHAKILTVQTWKSGAAHIYGYADWSNAFVGRMECFQNDYAAGSTSTFSDTREYIFEGGKDSDPWVCMVSGTQALKY